MNPLVCSVEPDKQPELDSPQWERVGCSATNLYQGLKFRGTEGEIWLREARIELHGQQLCCLDIGQKISFK